MEIEVNHEKAKAISGVEDKMREENTLLNSLTLAFTRKYPTVNMPGESNGGLTTPVDSIIQALGTEGGLDKSSEMYADYKEIIDVALRIGWMDILHHKAQIELFGEGLETSRGIQDKIERKEFLTAKDAHTLSEHQKASLLLKVRIVQLQKELEEQEALYARGSGAWDGLSNIFDAISRL